MASLNSIHVLCRQNGYTAVHVATQCGHVDMVGLLLERGASANLQSKNGLTALHLAAQDDRTPIARLLTRYGANIDPQTKVSFRPSLVDQSVNQSLSYASVVAGGFLFSD